jgi:hypothetical protein
VSGPSGNRYLNPDHLAQNLRRALDYPAEAPVRGPRARARIATHFINDRFARRISPLGTDLSKKFYYASVIVASPGERKNATEALYPSDDW